MDIVRHDPQGFLERAESWLVRAEDRHNLVLSIAHGRAGDEADGTAWFATVEVGDAVVGCAVRTPPHKLLVTGLPPGAAEPLAEAAADLYGEIPAVLGPPESAEAVARAWVALRGGAWQPGLEQGIYRLDEVTAPPAVSGSLRDAGFGDLDLAVEWGEGFARDSGVAFPTRRAAVERWIDHGALHFWDDGGAKSVAVAHGRTPRGVRIGYVYTPDEWRGRGYASACVAALSQKMLDGGADFCVLYTDLGNPTSNALYQRIGYRRIGVAQDFDLLRRGAG